MELSILCCKGKKIAKFGCGGGGLNFAKYLEYSAVSWWTAMSLVLGPMPLFKFIFRVFLMVHHENKAGKGRGCFTSHLIRVPIYVVVKKKT